MSPSQSGLLVGIRYFIEFCSAPFWGVVADRFKRQNRPSLFSLCVGLFNPRLDLSNPLPCDVYQRSQQLIPPIQVTHSLSCRQIPPLSLSSPPPQEFREKRHLLSYDGPVMSEVGPNVTETVIFPTAPNKTSAPTLQPETEEITDHIVT